MNRGSLVDVLADEPDQLCLSAKDKNTLAKL